MFIATGPRERSKMKAENTLDLVKASARMAENTKKLHFSNVS